jgi:hypothetical protein
MWLCLVMAITFAQADARTPQAAVSQFYAAYIKHHSSGFFLQGSAKRDLDPMLSKRLRQLLDAAAACQKDWIRQQPQGTTDKPPFVDCCLFSGVPDGMPTSFELGPTTMLPDGGYRIVVEFVRRETADVIRWRDAVLVVRDGARFAIDDVVFDADSASTDTDRLSDSFRDCRDRRWIGGRLVPTIRSLARVARI